MPDGSAIWRGEWVRWHIFVLGFYQRRGVTRDVGTGWLTKHVTPHTLRHTFATHLVRLDTNLVVIHDLLGHRQLTSTEVYLDLTVQDLRRAVVNHPVESYRQIR